MDRPAIYEQWIEHEDNGYLILSSRVYLPWEGVPRLMTDRIIFPSLRTPPGRRELANKILETLDGNQELRVHYG